MFVLVQLINVLAQLINVHGKDVIVRGIFKVFMV